ncbi:phage tail tip fiber protein [Pseudomonas sp. ICMP 19500]|uniref:phage tail tip fiber protein n=1 Tax=Pseudomonas sp. ICMP 19500 TaxID=1208102 RepID=UPI000AC7C953
MRVEASRELATAERLTTLQAGVDDAKGLIQQEEKVRATAIDVQAKRTDTVQASLGQTNASVQQVAKRTDTVQASLGQTNASVQQVSQVVAGLDGKVSAQTTIKAQTNVDGKKVMAGLALGSDGVTSEILAFAQRFAIIDEVSGAETFPFVVSGGQVFISSAVIQTGMITNAMIGNYIQSNNYVAGVSGWRLSFDGTFEMNGNIAGLGTMRLTNTFLKFIYANGVVGIDLSL